MYIKLNAYKNNENKEFYYNSVKKTFTLTEPTKVIKEISKRKNNIINHTHKFLKQNKLKLHSLNLVKISFTENNCIMENQIEKII